MKKLSLFILVIFIVKNSLALSLIQETKDILCHANERSLKIDKRDRYFERNSTRFEQIEFLDSAILGSSAKDFALVQMTQKNTALFIEGELFDFQEKDCTQVSDHKVCKKNNSTFEWAPTYIKINGSHFNIKHYGTYPNDGTYFIGVEGDEYGVALIDYGNQFSILQGQLTLFECQYN